uniref:U6 snRNA-associated Sm-like protein LSm8 n=3 Tax=Onchocercidae TaxID=6296 RepID=A0A0H5S1I3_BRUMA|nr:BMA-LSM-8 [Brugia malayi]
MLDKLKVVELYLVLLLFTLNRVHLVLPLWSDFSMTQTLDSFINKVISVITGDGRNIVGLMKGFDQTINLVLEDSHERVFSEDSGVEQIPLGLYIVRGDNVAVIGELDEDLDKRLDFSKMKAPPLGPVWLHM